MHCANMSPWLHQTVEMLGSTADVSGLDVGHHPTTAAFSGYKPEAGPQQLWVLRVGG